MSEKNLEIEVIAAIVSLVDVMNEPTSSLQVRNATAMIAADVLKKYVDERIAEAASKSRRDFHSGME